MRVIVVAAHPCEAEIYCGGTLARYVTNGDAISIAYIASGNLSDPEIEPRELGEIRHQEAEKSSALLNARLHWLGQSDHFVTSDAVTVMQLVAIFREFQPDVVLTHPPGSLTPDHDAVAQATIRAGSMAAVAGVESSLPALANPPVMYAMDGQPGQVPEPTEFVDIADQEDIKRRALSCYETLQPVDPGGAGNMVESMEIVARYRGLQAGLELAEGFRPIFNGRRMGGRRWLP